mgnify:CR=1 FL=1
MCGLGLSPATRGTRGAGNRSPPEKRFIPGYAGNATAASAADAPAPVYPRLRGERPSFSSSGCSAFGLSPATRGTPPPGQTVSCVWRFIPGYAGNAGCWHCCQRRAAVYPRLRGERGQQVLSTGGGGGLSPATRGTHSPSSEIRSPSRFIPGYAGNALQSDF